MESLGNSIIAKTIDDVYFTYECTNCWTKYNKDGEPAKTAKRQIHKYGSEGNLENRVENRGSHCMKNNKEMKIHITNQTIRQIKKNNKIFIED